MDGGLHERDFFPWTRVQAAALRRLAEEVEASGSEPRHAVAGNLRQMLRHLMFIACQPDDRAVPQDGNQP